MATLGLERATEPERLFFIGQDLDALRGYFGSACCVRPDGATAYLTLYRLLDGADFGGLGYGPNGAMLPDEASWGSGKVGALQTKTEFGVRDVAIGLFIAENEEPGGMYQIVSGQRDAEIRHLGQFIKRTDGTVFLRIGYEFDGAWNVGHQDTVSYIAVWRRIVDILRADGVTNVVFVWQASAAMVDDLIDRRHEDIRAWYPGDEYVDWMGLSWFLPPDQVSSVGGYMAPASRALADEVTAFARERGKPVMIAEASPQGFDLAGGFRANISPLLDGPPRGDVRRMSDTDVWDTWYAPLFDWMNTNRDVVRALAYINVNWDSQRVWGPPYEGGFWGDSRLETNPHIARRFNAAIAAWKAPQPSPRSR